MARNGPRELALAERRLEDVQRIVDATAPRVLGTAPTMSVPRRSGGWRRSGLAAAADHAERARAAKDDANLEEAEQESAR
jgi:hypothetical protein